jgi:hypothetical protein
MYVGNVYTNMISRWYHECLTKIQDVVLYQDMLDEYISIDSF